MAGRTVGPGHDIARIQHKFDDIWWEIPASLSVTSFGGGSERKPDRNPMTTAYRVIAFAIAAMVAFQVGAVGYAVFAQLNWIEKGGTVDEAAFATGVPRHRSLHVPRSLRRSGAARLARHAGHLVLREDPAGRHVGSHRLGLHRRPDRTGDPVAHVGGDRG